MTKKIDKRWVVGILIILVLAICGNYIISNSKQRVVADEEATTAAGASTEESGEVLADEAEASQLTEEHVLKLIEQNEKLLAEVKELREWKDNLCPACGGDLRLCKHPDICDVCGGWLERCIHDHQEDDENVATVSDDKQDKDDNDSKEESKPDKTPDKTTDTKPEEDPDPTPNEEEEKKESSVKVTIKLAKNKVTVGETVIGTVTAVSKNSKIKSFGISKYLKGLDALKWTFANLPMETNKITYPITVTATKAGTYKVFMAKEAAVLVDGTKSAKSNVETLEVVEKEKPADPEPTPTPDTVVVKPVTAQDIKVEEKGTAKFALEGTNIKTVDVAVDDIILSESGILDITEVNYNLLAKEILVSYTGTKVGAVEISVAPGVAVTESGVANELSATLKVNVTEKDAEPEPTGEVPVITPNVASNVKVNEKGTGTFKVTNADEVSVIVDNLKLSTAKFVTINDVNYADGMITFTYTGKEVGSTNVVVESGVAKNQYGENATSKELTINVIKSDDDNKDDEEVEAPQVLLTRLSNENVLIGKSTECQLIITDRVKLESTSFTESDIIGLTGATASNIRKVSTSDTRVVYQFTVTINEVGNINLSVGPNVGTNSAGKTTSTSNPVNIVGYTEDDVNRPVVTITGDGKIHKGETVTYTVTKSDNSGNCSWANVSFDMPAGATIVSTTDVDTNTKKIVVKGTEICSGQISVKAGAAKDAAGNTSYASHGAYFEVVPEFIDVEDDKDNTNQEESSTKEEQETTTQEPEKETKEEKQEETTTSKEEETTTSTQEPTVEAPTDEAEDEIVWEDSEATITVTSEETTETTTSATQQEEATETKTAETETVVEAETTEVAEKTTETAEQGNEGSEVLW